MSAIRIIDHKTIVDHAIDRSTIIGLVEDAIIGITDGRSINPAKVSISPLENSLTIAMLAYFCPTKALGLKSYTEFPLNDNRTRVGSSISLLNADTGKPEAYMDCQWITAARTAAVTALMCRESACKNPKKVLLIGSGVQATQSIPYLIHVCPTIEVVEVYAPRKKEAEKMIDSWASVVGDRTIKFCSDLEAAAKSADIVIGAAGPGAGGLVSYSMLKPGCVGILLGYGLASDILHCADFVVSTSEAQMHTTGMDLSRKDGTFPNVDAELPQILAGNVSGRRGESDIVFAYNSGLSITDVVVAKELLNVISMAGAGVSVGGF